MGLQQPIGPAAYLRRSPEHLVLQGYRCWTRGYAMRSAIPWQTAENLYRDVMGDRNARPALRALAGFVKTACLCARCPLAMMKPETHALCRDEVLVLGLIAGLQHGDDPTIKVCLDALCCPRAADRVAVAGSVYAFSLTAAGEILLPIPAHVEAEIADRPPHNAGSIGKAKTLH